jgi:hypothetical protein
VRGLAAAAIAAVTACSLLEARVPKHRGPDGHLECPEQAAETDKIAAIVSTIILAGAVINYEINQTKGEAAGALLIYVGIPSGVAASLTMPSALYGHHVVKKCRRLEADPTYAPDEAELERRRAAAADRETRALRERQDEKASAWKLAKQGETAAAAGDCATAIKYFDWIGVLDEETLRVEYMRDEHVAACIAAR